MAVNQAAEALREFLVPDANGRQTLFVPEGKYKGWVPRILYDLPCADVCLPFLRLLSFPVGGTSLGRLTEMERFNIVGNYLTQLPMAFGRCQNLVRLNISYNHLENIPAAIFQLANLSELDLSENDIVDVNGDICNLNNLKILNLSGNLLDDLPTELGQCKKLEKLDLSRKWYPKGGFSVLPEAVCYLTELSFLDVSWHQIHTIPEDVKNMSRLQTLRMRGNFLKHVSSGIAECKQLQYLDLTGAMKLNSVIPVEIFSLSELRALDLTNNYFSELSSEIVGLRKLKKFIMRRNALLWLPDQLFQMASLESIDVSENYIAKIPACVKDLKTLKHLYLAANNITELPDELCECENLVELQLNMNQLSTVPENLYKLSNLEELMLNDNQLTQLPLMLDKLEKLRETDRLSLYNNSLVRPPQSMCNQGVATVYGYLKELRICEAVHRKKLILIGASQAGKTSLRNALIHGKSKLTAPAERTWVLEQHLWEPEPEMRVQILDFGGHHIYSAAHHMFLTPEALHILVVDLSYYSDDRYDLLVGNWLEAIMDRAPGAEIMIVGTHADLCQSEDIEVAKAHILQQMHEEENNKIQDLENMLRIETERVAVAMKDSGQKFPDLVAQRMQERVQKMQKLRSTRVKLPDDIYVVSCAERLTGVINFHNDLTSTLKSSDGQALPQSWYKFLTDIQDRPEKILSWEDTLSIFEDVVKTLQQSLYMLQGSRESSLEMVLRYLHVTGEIVWYHENPRLRSIIFHHPETLVEMLRAIFRHDFSEVVNYDEYYGQVTEISASRFEVLKEEFLHRGLMTLELFHYTLLHFDLSMDARDTLIDLMLKFDLCYEVDESRSAPGLVGSKRILQFPWFLTTSPPTDFKTLWPDQTPTNTIELQMQLQFLKKGLPNFFEKVSARLQNYVTYRQDWSDGILAKRNKSKLLLTRNRTGRLGRVTLSVRGAELQELWFLMLKVRADMLALLQEWPFVKVDAYLVCSHCIATGVKEPFMWPGEALDVKCPTGIFHIQCPRTEPDVLIPACLVYPIDPEFHENDLKIHITVVTKFLQSIYDTVDSAGLLSDLVLNNIAARLGFEWNTVALHLGLSQKQIEHIQMDHPGNAMKQILTALLRWRDAATGDNSEKIEALLSAIELADNRELAVDLREQYCTDNS